MKQIAVKTFIISGICLLVACSHWKKQENDQLMQQAQLLVEQMPDSALILLDSINTMSFNDAKKAEYTLLRVQAKDMAGQDISTDTEILQVREYFIINEKDEKKAALACFYSAKVVILRGEAIMGMNYCLEALDHVRKTDDQILQGKILHTIGYLNDDKKSYADAIIRYKQAINAFRSAGGQYQREIHSLIDIGNSFMADEQQDSAMVYYNEALDRARLRNEPAMQVMVCNNMGVAYSEQGEYDAAEHCCRQALRLATGDNEKAYIYRNLAEVYYRKNMFDSVRLYLAKTEPLFENVEDIYALASLAQLRYQIEKSSGNYRESLVYGELYARYQKEISDQQDHHVLLEMQRKYDSTAKENQYHKEINRWWKISAGSAFILLILAALYVRAWVAGMKQKIALEKEKKEKREIELALEKTEREKKEKELAIEKVERENAEKELALEKERREKVEKQLALEKAERENEELKGVLQIFKKRDNEMQAALLEKMEPIRELVRSSQHLEGKTGVASQNFISNIKTILNKLTEQKFHSNSQRIVPGILG